MGSCWWLQRVLRLCLLSSVRGPWVALCEGWCWTWVAVFPSSSQRARASLWHHYKLACDGWGLLDSTLDPGEEAGWSLSLQQSVPRSLAPPRQWAVRKEGWMAAHLQPLTSVSVENIPGFTPGMLPPPGRWRYLGRELDCRRTEG